MAEPTSTPVAPKGAIPTPAELKSLAEPSKPNKTVDNAPTRLSIKQPYLIADFSKSALRSVAPTAFGSPIFYYEDPETASGLTLPVMSNGKEVREDSLLGLAKQLQDLRTKFDRAAERERAKLKKGGKVSETEAKRREDFMAFQEMQFELMKDQVGPDGRLRVFSLPPRPDRPKEFKPVKRKQDQAFENEDNVSDEKEAVGQEATDGEQADSASASTPASD